MELKWTDEMLHMLEKQCFKDDSAQAVVDAMFPLIARQVAAYCLANMGHVCSCVASSKEMDRLITEFDLPDTGKEKE